MPVDKVKGRCTKEGLEFYRSVNSRDDKPIHEWRVSDIYKIP